MFGRRSCLPLRQGPLLAISRQALVFGTALEGHTGPGFSVNGLPLIVVLLCIFMCLFVRSSHSACLVVFYSPCIRMHAFLCKCPPSFPPPRRSPVPCLPSPSSIPLSLNPSMPAPLHLALRPLLSAPAAFCSPRLRYPLDSTSTRPSPSGPIVFCPNSYLVSVFAPARSRLCYTAPACHRLHAFVYKP